MRMGRRMSKVDSGKMKNSKGRIFIIGDFNARVGSEVAETAGTAERYGEKARKPNTQKVKWFCEQ